MSHRDLIRVTLDDASVQTVAFAADHFSTQTQANQLSSCVRELLQENDDHEQLNLDFEQVDRIGSAGLNELIGINSTARSRGVRLVLLNVQESVREIFALTRLERMFEFESSAVTA